jgi:hypothetical protein
VGHRSFRYGEVGVRVESEDAEALAWLAEFVRPAFEEVDADVESIQDAPAVSYVSDAGRHAALARAMEEGPSEPAPCFALDTEVVVHPSRRIGSTTVLRDERRDVLYRVEGRAVEVVAGPASTGARLAFLRAVREAVAAGLRRRGCVLDLHAAAWSVGGEAVALAGGKEAGKTTCLAHALSERGARFLANDRAVVFPRGRGAVVRGMPTVVSLRAGTVERFPRLAAGVPNVERPSNLTVDEARRLLAEVGPHPGAAALRVSPALFCAQAGVPADTEAPLAAVLLAEIDPGADEARVEALSPRAAREGLARCRYGVRAGGAARTVFDDLVGGGLGAPDALEDVAARVPVLRLRLGPRAYDRPPSLERLLAAAREGAA